MSLSIFFVCRMVFINDRYYSEFKGLSPLCKLNDQIKNVIQKLKHRIPKSQRAWWT